MPLAALILYVGQRPLRAGRVALAVICWRADFEAYAKLGSAITGTRYVKAREPGEMPRPRSLLAAVRDGVRWGNVGYRLREGTLRSRDAAWVASEWRDGVPV